MIFAVVKGLTPFELNRSIFLRQSAWNGMQHTYNFLSSEQGHIYWKKIPFKGTKSGDIRTTKKSKEKTEVVEELQLTPFGDSIHGHIIHRIIVWDNICSTDSVSTLLGLKFILTIA